MPDGEYDRLPRCHRIVKVNAADYPKPASAQFGVGRACKAAGKDANAKASSKRALDIDPDFKKASDGRNALR